MDDLDFTTAEETAETVEKTTTEESTEVAEDTTETTEMEETEQEQDEQDEAEEVEEVPQTIEVKYNKKYIDVSLEEAPTYIQKGMKFDDMQPTLTKIGYLASAQNKSIDEFVKHITEAYEQQLEQSLREQANGNDDTYELLKSAMTTKNEKAYQAMIDAEKKVEEADKDDEESRLAGEFEELRKEYGEYKDFNDVPKAVLDLARKSNISLLDAQLRYAHIQARKATAEKARQEKTKQKTTGSAKTTDDVAVSDGFMAGFTSALGR